MLLSTENAFADRCVPVDPVIVARIITAYNLAKEAQKGKPDEYQVGNEWTPIYERYMGDIMAKLARHDNPAVATVYGNFFRDACSVGLHGMPVDMLSTYFSGPVSAELGSLYLNDLTHRFKIWLTTLGKEMALTELQTPVIGNPYGCTIDGVFYRSGVDYLHYYATTIRRLLGDPDAHHTVLELGGGFGGMAYFLMRDSRHLTYIDVDLPENMALTAFYLLSAFPEKKFLLYGEADLATIRLNTYDAVLLPNFEIERLTGDSIDLSFNSYSLAEMTRPTIHKYLEHINRCTIQYFFHVNHTSNCKVGADEFPVDLQKFALLFRAPALWNHARNKDMDEFEFVYKARP